MASKATKNGATKAVAPLVIPVTIAPGRSHVYRPNGAKPPQMVGTMEDLGGGRAAPRCVLSGYDDAGQSIWSASSLGTFDSLELAAAAILASAHGATPPAPGPDGGA